MRTSWECLFRVFDERLNLLLKIWRQYRFDAQKQVETFAGGLFENWYHFVRPYFDHNKAVLTNLYFAHRELLS